MPEMKATGVTGILANCIDNSGKNTDIMPFNASEIMDAIVRAWKSDTLCTCNARVICTSATEDSMPHHMQNGEGRIHIGNIEELNKTNIGICVNFEGCTKSPDGKCYIAEKYEEWIADKEWKAVDESSSQGEAKEKLNRDTSYMVCVEYGGIIYFYDDGQELQPYINGEAILYLSNEYWKWLEIAEGFTDHPYIDKADSKEAKARKNVTLGIGFTFDANGMNWDILMEVLGWTEEDINEIIDGLYSKDPNYNGDVKYQISHDKAVELVMKVAEREYMPNLNAAIKAYNTQQSQTTTYSQRELEAMFDYSYNNGLAPNSADNTYSTKINDPDTVIYYYLRRDQVGAVAAVKQFTKPKGMRRRLNQMNLFFNQNDEKGYDFTEDLGKLRNSLKF